MFKYWKNNLIVNGYTVSIEYINDSSFVAYVTNDNETKEFYAETVEEIVLKVLAEIGNLSIEIIDK